MQSTLRIGSRSSPLALAQSREVAARLCAAHGWQEDAIDIVTFDTKGDAIVDRSLSSFGGKGLFTQEIEAALGECRVDIAVHSAKDLPTELPAGLAIVATLPREDVRDAFLSPVATSLSQLPEGAVVGTSSLRRRALCLRLRPDLTMVEFRGNVATRMRKLEEGVADATLLALAGLKRLGLEDRAASVIEPGDFLPAVGQGTIAIEARDGDKRVLDLMTAIDDRETGIALAAERGFLAALDGSCRTPIGGLARIEGDQIGFEGIIVSPDGRRFHRTERSGSIADAAALGTDAGKELRTLGGPDFFEIGA